MGKRRESFSGVGLERHEAKTWRQIPAEAVLLLEICLCVLVCALCWWGFVELSRGVLTEPIKLLDTLILDYVQLYRSVELTVAMRGLTWLGSETAIGLGLILAVVVLGRQFRREAVTLVVMVLTSPLLGSTLKHWVQRPRPQLEALAVETTFSFPSGHALSSTVFYLLLVYFSYKATRKLFVALLGLLLASLLIGLIGLSRVYLGVHYPSDVLGGYLVGIVWFGGLVLMNRTMVLWRVFW